MKKIFATLIILAAASVWSAQADNNLPFINFGVKAGIVSDQTKVDGGTLGTLFEDANTGYQFGGVVRVSVPLLPIYVQPEILYTTTKFGKESTTASVSHIDVPVLVGAGIGIGTTAKVRVNAGPVFNVNSSSKLEIGGASIEDSSVFDKSMGWTAGAGIDLFGFTIDFRYNGQFKDSEGEFVGATSAVKTKNMSISVGYLF